MDPITTAIVAAVSAIGVDLVESGVTAAYEKLKAVIRGRWGEASPVSKAIAAVEDDPSSKAQAGVLAEKVEAAGAARDADVLAAVRELVERLESIGVAPGDQAVVRFNMTGGSFTGIGGAGQVQVGSMTIGETKKS